MAAKHTPKRKSRVQAEVTDLRLAVGAMNAGQHNPVNFLPILAFVAPIVARLAARHAVRLASAKAKRRFTSKTQQELIDAATVAATSAISLIRFTGS